MYSSSQCGDQASDQVTMQVTTQADKEIKKLLEFVKLHEVEVKYKNL